MVHRRAFQHARSLKALRTCRRRHAQCQKRGEFEMAGRRATAQGLVAEGWKRRSKKSREFSLVLVVGPPAYKTTDSCSQPTGSKRDQSADCGASVNTLTGTNCRISLRNWCRGWESNPHDSFESQDFKSCASASFATPACSGINSLRALLLAPGRFVLAIYSHHTNPRQELTSSVPAATRSPSTRR